jgi:hypothetical protein
MHRRGSNVETHAIPRADASGRPCALTHGQAGFGRATNGPMIQRVVLVKLDPQYVPEVRTVADHSTEVLAEVPGVRDMRAVVAADARTERDWHLCLLLRFDDAEAVEAYREHEVHRKYVDVYLRPMVSGIRAYNFAPAA